VRRKSIDRYYIPQAIIKEHSLVLAQFTLKERKTSEEEHTNNSAEHATVEVLGGVGFDLPKGKLAFLEGHDHTLGLRRRNGAKRLGIRY